MTTRSQIGLALLAGFAIGAAAVQGLHAAGSAPAYVVTEVGISDLDAYQKEYVPLVQASINAKPATGKADDMKAEFSVLTPAASGLRTCTGAPATPINAPRFLISASWA